MNNSKFYQLLFFCFMTLHLFAQQQSANVDLHWGNGFKDSKFANQLDVIGHDDEAMYTLKVLNKRQIISTPFSKDKREYSIDIFDKEMNLKRTEKIAFPKKSKFEFEFVTYFNDQLYLFYSLKDKSKKEIVLFCRTISKKTLQQNRDEQKVMRVPFISKGKAGFDYEISRDKSKLLAFAKMPVVKGKKQKLTLTVLEASGEKLWSKKITVPYKTELFSVESFRVTNSGDVYVLGLEFDKLSGLIIKGKKKKIKDGKANYSYQLLCYTDKGEQYTKIPVKLTDYYITDMQIEISNERELICAGFYSESGTYSVKGSCFLRIDLNTQEVLVENTMEFSNDLIMQNLRGREARKTSKKLAKGKDVELNRYVFKDLVLRSDGGVILIGEQYYVTKSVSRDGNGITSVTYYYHYNDIMVVNINPEGVIAWAEKIPKKQVMASYGGYVSNWYNSFLHAVVGDKIYFIFNDDPKNLTRQKGDKIHVFSKTKEATAVLVALNTKGEQSKSYLFDYKEARVVVRPSISEQISKNEIALYCQRRKVHQYAKLSFK